MSDVEHLVDGLIISSSDFAKYFHGKRRDPRNSFNSETDFKGVE